MKVKSIFLSMLAIATLASCSKEDAGIDPPVPQGEKMVVDLSVDTGIDTKAIGVPGADEDKAISDLTVFFVDGAGSIITKKYLNTGDLTDAAGVKSAKIETKSTAVKMLAIANVGSDLTTGANPLNVGSETLLKAVVKSLITSSNTNQVKGNLLMSAEGTLTDKSTSAPWTANANATAKFVAAKITLSSLSLGSSVQGVYGDDFKFDGAFLLNVQTNSYYFPTSGSYVPTAPNYVNGVNWQSGWGDNPGHTVVSEFNLDLSGVVDMTTPATDQGHFYVFENRPTSTDKTQNPTTLVVQVEWKQKKNPETKVKKMFNVIFAPGEAGVIEAGKAYNVALTFNGDFRPEEDGGGSGGGGTDTPDEQNLPTNVSVSVTPASWTDTSTNKPF
ncbi:hypothetical protein M1P97_16990 [Parabacteroides sp. GYB001]|uniref:fimbrial protein n=1 Tax=Parabacteroides leei TaxID=2939491 RepID=UPI002017C3C2|nr:fimbrial protein [Parabacteroides leei]MCL3852978.1 hypothetical protein [Parabacteroides leei]